MTEVLSCSDSSLQAGEPLAASASVADRWLLVEVRGAWGRDALTDSGLSSKVHAYLGGFPGKVILIRRPDRRRGVTVVHAIAGEAIGEAVRQELQSLELLPDIDLSRGERVDGAVVLVCAHGRRDACCARLGGRLFDALLPAIPPARLWQASHLGGHRFAPNVVVVPQGLQFGRVPIDRAVELARSIDAGRIPLDLYRGRTIYPQPVQAAELLVRTVTGHDGIADLRLVSHDPGRVTFSTPSGVLTAHVEERPGPTVPASCGATPEPTSGWAASLDL